MKRKVVSEFKCINLDEYVKKIIQIIGAEQPLVANFLKVFV